MPVSSLMSPCFSPLVLKLSPFYLAGINSFHRNTEFWKLITTVIQQQNIRVVLYTCSLFMKERYWPFYDMVRVWNYNTYTQFPHSLSESKWYWDKSNSKISFQSALKIHKHQFSRWAPVLWPKSSKTLFGPIVLSILDCYSNDWNWIAISLNFTCYRKGKRF
jgi:hypothetical protein